MSKKWKAIWLITMIITIAQMFLYWNEPWNFRIAAIAAVLLLIVLWRIANTGYQERDNHDSKRDHSNHHGTDRLT